jgi:hypothetical protein
MAASGIHIARHDHADESPLHHILVTQAFLEGVRSVQSEQLTDANRTR